MLPVFASMRHRALVVLGTLVPDLVIVRSSTTQRDRDTITRLAKSAPEIPIRLIDAPAALEATLEETPVLN